MAQFKWWYTVTESERARELRENVIVALAGSRYDSDALERLFSVLEKK